MAGSGNSEPGAGDVCSVTWPATRSEVMSVGAMNSHDDSVEIEDSVRDDDYGWGTYSFDLYGGQKKTLKMVDLIASPTLPLN